QKGGEALRRTRIEPIEHGILLRTYLAGGVGLLAVVASVLLSLLFARRITEELRALQRTAQELAHERLPRVVARLRRGEPVDVATEAPPPVTGRTLEIAQVADAFGTVQRTALTTAVGEAELRASINQVFINLSWRSQSLLHRQLRLLDQMERRAASAEELDDLFSLDHLTTRMRRHAEGLVILAGAPTARAWDRPVPAEDVVRAAIAEVEDYTRVEVIGAASSAVVGEVVADVIHLLAELIENAAAFSPPTTEVTVKVESAANGLVVEIVDRGLGLHPAERDALNQRLASAAEFDMVDTERLGLFVVARLAARHGIQVTLEASVYGGTTAIVLIPHSLVSQEDLLQPERSAAGPAGRVRLGRPLRPELPEAAPTAPAHPTGFPHVSTAHGATGHANGFSPASGPPPWTDTGDAPPSYGDREGARGEWHPETAGGIESSEVTGRLPRRIPQQSMAPQLRRDAAGPEPPQAEPDFDEPSPDFSRNLMDSLQAGWLRGRDTEKDDDAPIE
ncbi:HAMP domain-containing protein, partial [Actinomadura sp. LD22]